MKLTFSNCKIPGKIWKLYIPEDRGFCWIQYETEGAFFLIKLDFEAGSTSLPIRMPEDRLLLHSSSDVALVFKRFPRRDWPISVGMASMHIATQKLTIFEKASPIEPYDEEHWRVQYEGEGEIILNTVTGKTFSTAEERKTSGDPVLRYEETNPYYPELQKFISQKLKTQAIGTIEYSESNEGLLLAFHSSHNKQTFDTVCAFWNLEGQLIWKDDCFTNLNGPADVLVCGNKDWIVYLKNEQELVVAPWNKA